MKLDFSAAGWAKVIAGTVFGTAFCIAMAFFVDSFNFHSMTDSQFRYSLMVNTLLPTGLAAPLLFLLLYKMRQLAIAHHEISIIASTDSLTAVLNRGAFKMLVDAYLQQAMRQPAQNAGAFLVIDADHFKSINDRFGHQKGDVALKIIAQTIQGSLRQGDIVGRIGGEEFGVFLPKTGLEQALHVAERIRMQIGEVEFPPDTMSHSLSVSVGGAAFGRNADYDDLFRVADKCLYSAKAGGRNQVIFERLVA
ncbi:diguanylate cyclase (GGDEF) domain-containing protein [Hoeflea sp. IMCC20628]|uniref:GGDEF domain-containing protein n=1 Tax=Hoeflea sp. IMCC20628 TaxID=1620421 RepID=UPI00063AEC12|nr:GGDEF domain-containing protein [Hoeflea sp. IMCC20628]AKH99358.1 diguanylate cyclase (GGDEF) domain-containing protein [Hoeflea sp. IMCC20628]